MKKAILFPLLLLLAFSASAQLDFIIDHGAYFTPEGKAYYEFNLSLNGSSIAYEANANGKHQGKVEFTYIIQKGDSIIAFEKFQLLSPEYELGDIPFDVVDQKKMLVPPGDYQFEVLAKDLITPAERTASMQLESSLLASGQLGISTLSLLDSFKTDTPNSTFVKNGLAFFPNYGSFFKQFHQSLSLYLEIYQSEQVLGKNEAFLLSYSIVGSDKETVVNNIKGYKRLNTAGIIPFAQEIPIENLPSGNYYIKVSLKNKQNETLASKIKGFQRSNPKLLDFSVIDASNSFVANITSVEEIKEYIKMVGPISSYDELQFAQNQLSSNDLSFMQRYFLNFWKTRDQNDPEHAWKMYKIEVDKVDKEFGYGGIKGYQTERGRIYLQYGAPNARQKVPYEPNTYPYSIWQYYKINGQANRKFIFYSPSMEMLGYQLLHSNVPGEIRNPNWQSALDNKTVNRGNTYELQQGETLNERAKDLFDNPR